MENFIDIMTPTELEEYYGEKPEPEQVARDREFYATNVDYNNRDMFLLWCDRGDRVRAKKYYDNIKDPLIQLEAAMTDGDSRYENA